MLEQSLEDFKKHHKNPFNIFFHIVCGMIYISIFLYLLGRNFIILYILVLIVLFPSFLPEVFFIGLILVFLHNILCLLSWPTWFNVMLILITYFAPELSHWATHEPTVLKPQEMTVLSIFENFFFLLPFSVFSMTSFIGYGKSCSASRTTKPQKNKARTKRQ